MFDWYPILDKIIKEEIDKGQRVAIYTQGMIGLYARDILNKRYGREGIYVDNHLAEYNKEIITIDCFMDLDAEDISIIVCASDIKLNEKLQDGLRKRAVKATIRSLWEKPQITSVSGKDYAWLGQIKKLCLVAKAKGIPLVRMGRQNDGGYVLLNDFSGIKTAYGFGIGGDCSFEKDLGEAGLNVYCYDPTIDHLPESHFRLHFEKIGISGKDMEIEGCPTMLSMESILERNTHQKEENMILKMDVEGAEWNFINSTTSETLERFAQMTFEFHYLTSEEKRAEIFSALEKINKTHQAVWVHANSVCGGVDTGEELFPNVLEITYANKRRYQFEDIDYNSPLPIDSSNRVGILDLPLRHWGKLK